MISGRTIVCIGSSWDYDPTSKHHLMRLLSAQNRILWVNYHGTRRPGATKSDVAGAWSVLRRVARGVERVSESMWQLTPLVIPGASNNAVRHFNEQLLMAQIKRALNAIAQTSDPIQVWCFAPDVPFLVDQLGEEVFIYYCVDDYTKFQGHDAVHIVESETELLHRADLVITTSAPLWEEKRQIREDAKLLRHGVDFDHFTAAWRQELPCPRDLEAIPGPRIGFFGLIQHWIDTSLLAEVARQCPNYSFVLIGEAKSEVAALKSLRNVHLLGRRTYSELPAYCAHFDAALLPFAANEMTRCVNPIKMHEYLAAGLPIVSTPLPEAERLAPPIRIAATADEFAAACTDAIATPTDQRGLAMARLVMHDSWESKVEALSVLVSRHVEALDVIRQSSNDATDIWCTANRTASLKPDATERKRKPVLATSEWPE